MTSLTQYMRDTHTCQWRLLQGVHNTRMGGDRGAPLDSQGYINCYGAAEPCPAYFEATAQHAWDINKF